ncbi:MAG: antibiotic biosynthesis monooxygenase [Acidobacteriota bacterium]
MGQFVIACYRPRPGKEARLLELLKEHMPVLRGENLVTDRPSCVMRAGDGTFVEVFEWRSAEAIERAHANETVKAMWKKFEEVCKYEVLANLKEARQPFSPFQPVEW